MLSFDDWKALHELHGAPTFFASPAWTAAVCEHNPQYESYTLKCTLDSGQSVFIPLIRIFGGKLRWRLFVGMPFGAYTAILTQNGLLANQGAIDEVLGFLSRCHADSIEIALWPLGPQPSIVSDAFVRRETSVIDLSRGAEAAITSMEGSSRRMATQAQRKGVTCSVERGPAATDAYFDILSQAAAKWGLEQPTISKELLLSLVTLGGDDVEIWIARFDGSRRGGLIWTR